MLKKRRILIVVFILMLGIVLSVNFFLGSEKERDMAFYTSRMEERMAEVIQDFEEDYIQLIMANPPNVEFTFSSLTISHHHPFYIFSKGGELQYWSDIEMVPQFGNLNLSKKYQLIDNERGVYFTKLLHLNRNGKEFWLLHAYPLVHQLTIENKYLPEGFDRQIFGNDRFVLANQPKERYQDVYFEDDYLFSIFFRVGFDTSGTNTNHTLLVFFFSLLGLVLIIGGDFVYKLWTKGQKVIATFYTFLILGCIRILMLAFSFPNDFFQTGIFDPSLYASSKLNPSLGDLLLNVICYLVVLSMVIAILGSKRLLFSFFKFRKSMLTAFNY